MGTEYLTNALSVSKLTYAMPVMANLWHSCLHDAGWPTSCFSEEFLPSPAPTVCPWASTSFFLLQGHHTCHLSSHSSLPPASFLPCCVWFPSIFFIPHPIIQHSFQSFLSLTVHSFLPLAYMAFCLPSLPLSLLLSSLSWPHPNWPSHLYLPNPFL